MVLGALRGLLERGYFTTVPSVAAEIEQWRIEADQARQFVQECCELDPEYQVAEGPLYTTPTSSGGASTESAGFLRTRDLPSG